MPLTVTEAAVRRRLDRVTDPELDQSIVALGYVEAIEVDLPTVHVEFSLPTAWCSPAFAWMMATDARREVESLDGIDRAVVVLTDHMHETEITEGVNAGRSFEASFPDADGEVESVRRDLDRKALLSRQHATVSALLDAGLSRAQVVELTPERIEADGQADAGVLAVADDGAGAEHPPDDATATVFVRDGAVGISVPLAPLTRYLEKATLLGVVSDGTDQLFRTPDGDPLTAENFELVHQRTRLTATNMDSQGGICAYLHEARQGRQKRPGAVDAD